MRRIYGWNEISRKLNIYKDKTKTLYPYKTIAIYYFPETHSVGAALSYSNLSWIEFNKKAICMNDILENALGAYPETWHNTDVKKILREYIKIWEEK